LGFNSSDVDFVRFVNARLDDMRSDGEWTSIYNRWLRDSLGPAPKPPIPVYGRTR
jgi:polar amino acid transport system substrate-binding protein